MKSLNTYIKEDIFDINDNTGALSVPGATTVKFDKGILWLDKLPGEDYIKLYNEQIEILNKLTKHVVKKFIFKCPIIIQEMKSAFIDRWNAEVPIFYYYCKSLTLENCEIHCIMFNSKDFDQKLEFINTQLYCDSFYKISEFPIATKNTKISCDIFVLSSPNDKCQSLLNSDLRDSVKTTNLDKLPFIKNKNFKFDWVVIGNPYLDKYSVYAIKGSSKSKYDKFILPYQIINKDTLSSPRGEVIELYSMEDLNTFLLTERKKFV